MPNSIVRTVLPCSSSRRRAYSAGSNTSTSSTAYGASRAAVPDLLDHRRLQGEVLVLWVVQAVPAVPLVHELVHRQRHHARWLQSPLRVSGLARTCQPNQEEHRRSVLARRFLPSRSFHQPVCHQRLCQLLLAARAEPLKAGVRAGPMATSTSSCPPSGPRRPQSIRVLSRTRVLPPKTGLGWSVKKSCVHPPRPARPSGADVASGPRAPKRR